MTNQQTTTKEALEPCPRWTVTYNIVSPESDAWVGTGWEFFNDEKAAEACYKRHRNLGNIPTKRAFYDSVDRQHLGAVDRARVSAPIVAPEVDQQTIQRNDSNVKAWGKIFDRVTSTVPYSDEQPLRSVIKDANTVIKSLYKEILSLRAAPAATVAPQQSVAARCPDCGARLTSDFDEDVGMWEECTECDYRNMMSNRSAPASPAALRDEAKARYDLDPLEFWCDLAEVLGHPRPAKADVPALVSEVKERLAATTPPSTLAEVAASKIASYLFANIFHPARQGGISEAQEAEIAAIIERCLAGGDENLE